MCNAGMIPNSPEHPRDRKATKRERTRFFNEAIHAVRMGVERPLAWEDTCKRRRLRCERLQQRHSGMQVLAETLSNLRAFCGAYNSQPVHAVHFVLLSILPMRNISQARKKEGSNLTHKERCPACIRGTIPTHVADTFVEMAVAGWMPTGDIQENLAQTTARALHLSPINMIHESLSDT
jgi:hypothetical protein